MSEMSLTFSNIQLQEFFHHWRNGVQPWSEFLDTRKFMVPRALLATGRRVKKNIFHFRSNYAFVAICVIAFAVFTSPLLLVALALTIGTAYTMLIKYAETRFVFVGMELTQRHRIGVVGFLTLVYFWLLGAGAIVFWIVGFSLILVSGHAATYVTEDDSKPMDLPPAEVV